jgi:PAS domain S-box-containing protein
VHESVQAVHRESGRDVLWMSSPDFAELLYVSPAFEALWGRPSGPLADHARAFWAGVHPEDVAHVRAAIDSASGGRAPFDVEYRILRPDGLVRWVHDRAFAMRDESGRVQRMVGVAEDVTDLKRAQDELERARRQMAQSERLAALGSLVSGLAHEVRTPLATAMNHVSVLSGRLARVQAEGPLPAPLQDAPGHVAATLDALDRINRLVEDLRRFTKLEPGRRAVVGLEALAAETVRLFQSAHRGQLEVDAQLARTTPVEVDKVQLEQAILALLENAAEAIGSGSVRVTTRDSPIAVELVVEDRGPGIPLDIQAHVFDEFFTTKPGRAGLGLSIARRIVEAHGGTLQLRSRPGEGATFTLSLPKGARRVAVHA